MLHDVVSFADLSAVYLLRPSSDNMSTTERTNRLKNKVAIVTGAGSRSEDIGNGRAASVLLARAGAKVVLVDLNSEWVQTTLRIIETETERQGGIKG